MLPPLPPGRLFALVGALALALSIAPLTAQSTRATTGLSELFTPADSTTAKAWSQTLILDAASGLPDADVLDATWHGDHLLAGTRSGLFAYDGLTWTILIRDGAVHWVASHGGAVYAGGDRGLWRVDPVAANSSPVDDAPDSIRSGILAPFGRGAPAPARTSASEVDPSAATSAAEVDRRYGAAGDLLIGTTHGLYRYDSEGRWTAELDSVSVTDLATNAEGRLYVGTFGQGLRWRDPPNGASGAWNVVRSPWIGVSDSLPGDFVHDIEIDDDGVVHLATSAYTVGPRYRIYQNARLMGLVDEEQEHVFAGAAYAEWNHDYWRVRHLYQHYRVAEGHGDTESSLVIEDDVDEDGRIELVFLLSPGRNLAPRAIVCFDRDTGVREWLHRFAGKPQLPLLIPGADGPEILLVASATDHGARYGGRRDDTTVIYAIDAQGRRRVLREWPGRTSSGIWTLTRPGPKGPVPVGIYLLLTSLDSAGAQELWHLDLATREWERAPNPSPFRVARSWRALEDARGHLTITLAVAPEPVIQLRDLSLGRVLGEWSLPELFPEQANLDQVRGQIRRVAGDWQILLGGDRRYCLIDTEGVRFGEFPEAEAGGARSWVRGPVGEMPLVISKPGNGPLRLWRPREGLAPALSTDAPTYDRQALSLPDDLELPLLEADDYELLLTHDFSGTGPSFSRFRLIYPREPGMGRIITLSPGSRHTRVFDLQGRVLRSILLPEPLRSHPDLHWPSGSRAWIDGFESDLYLGPCHGIPYLLARHDLLSEEALTLYDPGLPFVDRGCVALWGLAPREDLLASERGIKRARWEEQADLAPWLSRRPTRGLESGQDRILGWGSRGVTVLAEGARCVDPEITDLLVDEKSVAWVRGTELSLRPSSEESTTRRWHLEAHRHDEGTDWTLYPSDRGVWAWHVPRDRSTVTLRHFGFDGEASRELSEQTWHEGATRPVSAAFALGDARWLLFADQGLLVADLGEGEALFPIVDQRWSFRAAIATEQGWLAVGHRGEMVEVQRSESGFEAHERERLDLPESVEVLALVESGRDRFVLTRSRIVRLNTGQVWTAPAGADFRCAAARAEGGLWLGTSNGLARLALDSPEVIPLQLPGLPSAPVRRIVDEEAESGRILWLVSNGEGLFRCELPSVPTLRMAAARDSVRLALWPGVRSSAAAVDWRWRGQESWRRASLVTDEAGRLSFALQAPSQGRRQLEVRAFDTFGRDLLPAATPTFVWRLSSPAVQALLLLGLVGLAFTVRWRPRLARVPWGRMRASSWIGRLDTLPWSVPFLLLALPLLLLIHFQLLIDVPWVASAVVGVGVVGMDALSRRVQSRRRLAPEPARAELLEILLRFHHRGGGIGPVNELLLTLRNLAALGEAGQDPIAVVRGLCAGLLDATDALRRDLVPLAVDAQIDGWLIDRIESPLRFLRERAHECVSSSRESWPRLLEPRSRHSMIDAGESFLGGIDTLHRALVDEGGCDAVEVLRRCARRYRRQTAGHVTIEVSHPEAPVPTRIPQSELEELLDNLVRNAFTALAASSDAQVRFHLSDQNGALRLRVEDNGPGIPDTVLPRLFEPGVSGGNGHGFGLARCQALVRSWGGSILATNRTDTSGARFLVEVGRESSG